MPRRIVIHAGFHKTGTTSIQKTLRANRARLRSALRIVLRPGMKPLCETARGYSATKSPMDLGLVRYEAAQLAESWEGDDGTILISSEDLSGHMPGRHGLRGYGAAPALMQALAESFAAALPGVPLTFFFTTRHPDPWLASCYSQHLRATRMTLTAPQYARKFSGSAALDAVIDAVADALPGHTVLRAALEDHAAAPLGPLTPILQAAGVDAKAQKALEPLPVANAAPPADRLAELLALNRSDLPDTELRATKKALMRGVA